MNSDRTLAGALGQTDQCVKYVGDAAIKHVKEAMSSDGKSDDLVTDTWLGDCPQDIITQAVAEVLGLERLEQLVSAAEAAGDQWTLGRRAILAGYACQQRGGTIQDTYGWFRRGLDALEKLGSASGTATEERETQEALELTMFGVMSPASDPQDAARIPRMVYLLEQDHLDRCACACLPAACLCGPPHYYLLVAQAASREGDVLRIRLHDDDVW